jgi:ABC-type amino acid transport substrate-binding protein
MLLITLDHETAFAQSRNVAVGMRRAGEAAMIVIGHDPAFAPISFRDAEGNAAGLAIDPLARILDAAGIAHRFEAAQPSHATAALDEGAIDALAAFAVTPGREAIYDFAPPWFDTGAAFFAPVPFDPVSAAGGTTIATPAAGPLVQIVPQLFPSLGVIAVESYEAAFAAVREGDAQAAALNIHAGAAHAQAHHWPLPGEPFLRVRLGLAVRKGSFPQLLRVLAGTVQRRRGSGVGA